MPVWLILVPTLSFVAVLFVTNYNIILTAINPRRCLYIYRLYGAYSYNIKMRNG